MKGKRYQVCTESGNVRGKNYYFDDIDSAVAKAKQLQKRRKDNNPSVIIEVEVSPNGFYSYPVKNRIFY